MSSFFTVPASQRKRKRTDTGTTSAPTKRSRGSLGAGKGKSNDQRVERPRRDESISGSESGKDESVSEGPDGQESTASSDNEEETGAERRLRLAERYLENIKGEVDEAGFDAADVDRDLIAERLKEDVAETKGRLHRFIASDYDFSNATPAGFRMNTHLPSTSIAICPPYVYTVSKDISLRKWELPEPKASSLPTKPRKKAPKQPPSRQRPKQLLCKKGSPSHSKNPSYQHHTSHILCVAVSSDGRFVATGGADKRLLIWSAADLTVLRIFTQHRDAVTSLAFRRGTNQLYSSSADRTIKTWSLDELAYIETLFGHQDQVVDIAALGQERCLSAGARDRTVRLWKVVEETQLVFRGGGGGGDRKSKAQNKEMKTLGFSEGSIERVAYVDEETFVSGSDNGALSLWSVHKKKPVYTLPAAHGFDPPLKPEEAFAEAEMEGRKVPSPPEPRWITALKVIPYSDLILTGSWDGWIRAWKIAGDRKKIEFVGSVGKNEGPEDTGMTNGDAEADEPLPTRGVVNDIEAFERGDKGKEGLCIVAALGKEHRLGRWKKVDGKNGAIVFEVSKAFVSKKDQAAIAG